MKRSPEARAVPEPPAEIRVRLEPAGFLLEAEGGWALAAVSVPGGWRIEGSGKGHGGFLRRSGSPAPGFVLTDGPGPEGTETGRTTRFPDAEGESSPSYLLAGDGRLFRILYRVGRLSRCELVGWEVPGAYLTARPEGEGWRVQRTTSGRDLDGLSDILLLFVAEVLDLNE